MNLLLNAHVLKTNGFIRSKEILLMKSYDIKLVE